MHSLDLHSGQLRRFASCLFVCFFSICASVLSAQNVTVTNVFQNHYHYGYPLGSQDCASGYNIPSGQYTSTYHLERGHAIHHLDPKNAANDYWVYWAHFDNSSYGVAEVAVFKSTSECGPYILQSQTSNANSIDGSGYGFLPSGLQSRDENIFRDTDQAYNLDGTVANYASAYLATASVDSPTCTGANCAMAIMKMTPDYLGIDSTYGNNGGVQWVFVNGGREAPVILKQNDTYFLICSQAAGWYPSQGGYGSSKVLMSTSTSTATWPTTPVNLGNSSTFGGQTSDGFMIAGTQANTYVLTFDHLGGADSKNPANAKEQQDTGEMWLPVILNSTTGTATMNWYPSWSVDNTTGVLALPTLTNLATSATATATVATNSSFPISNAIDGDFTTRWTASTTGGTSFNAAIPAAAATAPLCPVTGAITSTTCNPSLIVDLGSVQPIQEIDLSWYMIKGSEPYYTFKLAYSSDKSTWTTQDYTTFASAGNATVTNISVVPFSNNITYGFNSLPVNFSARYVALIETSAIVQNQTASPYNTIYGPNTYEMGIIQSTAPPSPQPVIVSLAPSSSSPATDSSFTVGVTVTGPTGKPTPTGYIQLSAPGYASEIYGLVNGANSFTIPAGATTGGAEAITVSYRPDAVSAPVYGIGSTTGTANVSVSTPDAPTNLTLIKAGPGALAATWSASVGATSYVLQRSSDGGATYTQIGNPTAASYADTGLNNDSVNYCYKVAAVNNGGTGSFSSDVCSIATSNFPVTGITVTPSAPGALTIAYSAVSNTTGYIIKRSSGGSAYVQTVAPTTTSYIDSGLTSATIYCYTLAAVFSTGTANDSSPVCNTATNNLPPTNLAVTKWASASLRITWLPTGSASLYALKRSVAGAAYTTISSSLTAPQYVDSSLTNDATQYCYTISETLSSVTSPDTNPVCNTPTASFLSVPNYSFEAPSEASALWQTDPPASTASWTFTGTSGSTSGNNSGISIQTSGTWAKGNGGGSGAAAVGSQVAYLEQAGSISQTVSGFTPGQTYSVIVAASQRQSAAQTANPFNIAVNGTSVSTFSPLQSNPYYLDYGVTFTATGASNTIAILGTSSSSTSAVLLDNIRIFPYTGSPVIATKAISQISLTQNQPAVTSTPITGAGGGSTLNYSISPALPAGLSFSTLTGSVTGTPTTASAATTYNVSVNDNDGSSASATFSLSVNSPATASVAISTATLVANSQGAPFIPITGSSGTGALTYSISPALPSGLSFDPSTGTVSGTPNVVSAAVTYAVTIKDVNLSTAQASFSLTIDKQGTSSILSASSTSIVPNQSVTLTAKVAAALGGTPSGTVSFFDGTTALQTVSITGGSASYTTTSLLSGIHSITVTYSGDSVYSTSSASGATNITVAPLDFSLSSSGLNLATVVTAGKAATFAFAVSPTYGTYPGTVSFSVSAGPPGASYTFSPTSISPTSGQQTITLTVQTAASQAVNVLPHHWPVLAFGLLLLPLVQGSRKIKRFRGLSSMRLVILLGGALALVSIAGCGDGMKSGTSIGALLPYGVNVTATAGSVSHLTTVVLYIQSQ